MKYYNFSLFHYVENGFIAQTGKPWSRNDLGNCGASIFFLRKETDRYYRTERKPRLKHATRGTVSMINNGDGLLGSQFLITLGDNLDTLDHEHHCVFGEAFTDFEDRASEENHRIIDAFNSMICNEKTKCPLKDVRILHTVVLEDPYSDPDWLVRYPVPRSPALRMLRSCTNMIGLLEAEDQNDGLTEKEIEELQENKEAKNRATVLTIVGDLPDADVKPPDNVLFVCRLNPVTNDDDLRIIFSRFGPIELCEIIRDTRTGNSLCYAFIEFERKEDCERAFFKMDNVLIDDRRIHVDFCQSVARVAVPWKARHKSRRGGGIN